ncbi:MAG: hypothetical protein B0A82_08165 [Alkalinema sp. CACIAM 70d]|nr:MAG: hypothetical protein B0A82_08165 [Alkalinema sp. CACIAM 70d]
MSKEFPIGAKVRLIKQPPYVKTAEPKPMLRPSQVLCVGEEGIVLDRYPSDTWGIRFERGAFLLDSQYLELVIPEHS